MNKINKNLLADNDKDNYAEKGGFINRETFDGSKIEMWGS